jgi:putative redox protein
LRTFRVDPTLLEMTTATSDGAAYRTSVRSGDLQLLANTLKEGVGGTDGFRPHDLLEAALAACMNITARMAAEKAGVAVERVTTSARLDREGDGPVTFRCSLSISGELSEEERAAVANAVARCPVRRTLSRGIQFAFEATQHGLPG